MENFHEVECTGGDIIENFCKFYHPFLLINTLFTNKGNAYNSSAPHFVNIPLLAIAKKSIGDIKRQHPVVLKANFLQSINFIINTGSGLKIKHQ